MPRTRLKDHWRRGGSEAILPFVRPLFLSVLLAASDVMSAAAANGASDALPMGRCIGSAASETAPTDGKSYEIGSGPAARQTLPAWNFIGYKENLSGRLIGPDERPVDAA